MSTKQTRTYNGSTNSNQWTWKQVVTEIWNDDYITTNQSQINVKTYLGRASSNSYFGGVASVSITCNGETRNSSKTFTYPTYINAGQWVLAQESNFTVEHNADGTKSISISSSMSTSDFTPSSASASGSMTLSTIPRATACPNISGYIEEGATIILNPASSSFKHKIWFDYNGKKVFYPSRYEYFKDKGVIPLDTSFYALTPGQVGTCQIELYTFDENGNDIGMKTATLTIRCDENRCKPIIDFTVKDTNPKTTKLTGDSNKLIKGYSDAQITYSITPRNSATISSKSINDSYLGASPYTINKINTNTFKIRATDSRDFDNYKEISKTMVNYIPLSLNFNVFRTTPTGSEIQLEFEGNWFPGDFGAIYNNIEVIVKYRELPNGEIQTAKWLSYNTDYVWNNDTGKLQSGLKSSKSPIVIPKEFPYNKSYEIILEYYDKLTHTTSSKQVPKGQPVLNWKDDLVNVNGKFTINNVETKFEESRNLFDKNNYSLVDGQIGFDVSNLKIGEVYTISSNKPLDHFKISNYGWGYNSVVGPIKNTYTFTMAKHPDISGTQYLFLAITGYNFITDVSQINGYEIQIEKGSLNTPYKPYSLLKEIQINYGGGFQPFLGMESGSNENGNWIKYSDGTMITNQRFYRMTRPQGMWGNMYSFAFDNLPNYPKSFISMPTIIPYWHSGYNGFLCSASERGEPSINNAGGFQVLRPTEAPGFEGYINVIAIGRWK